MSHTIPDCYICSGCGERVDEEVEISKDKYGCPYCAVYDENTGEL